ncbi:MAG: FCD domain-containing protein [Pseudorhodoplanes sp.]
MDFLTVHLKQRHVELIQRILDVIREDHLRIGDRLPEQVLAARCNVSRTPVRKALSVLADRKIAARDADGGFRVLVDQNLATGVEHALPSSAEERLSDLILRDLAARRIDPSQTIAALQRRYGAARPVVQNTLQRMSADQLVERAAGQLWIFLPAATSAESMAWSYEYRMVLEPAALLSKSFMVDVSALAAIRRSLEAVLAQGERGIDLVRFEPADFEFHALIARSCGNSYISSALEAHHRKRRMPMKQIALSSFRLIQSTQEHLSILACIEQGQLDAAADLMRVHLRMSQAQRPVLAGRGVPSEMRGSLP